MAAVARARPAPTWRRFLARTARGERLGWAAYLWALHRISGVILVLYFLAHAVVLAVVLQGASPFDRLLATFENPVVRLLELGLVAAAAFHALNGGRLILLHLFPDWDQHLLGYGAVALAALLVLAVAVWPALAR